MSLIIKGIALDSSLFFNWSCFINFQVTNAVTKEMLKNPALLSALQGKLDSMAGTTSGYIEVSIS